MPPESPSNELRAELPDEYEYTVVRATHDELDGYIKKVFKLSTSPTDALDDDDWSFIVKMSAYVEAALNELLKAHFNDRRLDTIIEKMGMGSDRQGKLAFTKKLDLLPFKTWQFIDLLCELRGQIVHRISELNLNLATKLQNSEKKETWKMVLIEKPIDDPEANKILGAGILAYPRFFIFRTVMGIMARTALQTDRTKLEHEIDAWMSRVGQTDIYRRKKERPPEPTPKEPEESRPKDRTEQG